MKDAQRRARLTILKSGLILLMQRRGLYRKDIFNVPEKEVDARDRATVVAEIQRSTWQREVLTRLVKYNVLKETPKGYEVTDLLHLIQILSSHEEMGLRLAWFVLPHEVPDGAPENYGFEVGGKLKIENPDLDPSTTSEEEEETEEEDKRSTEEKVEKESSPPVVGMVDAINKTILSRIDELEVAFLKIVSAYSHSGLTREQEWMGGMKEALEFSKKSSETTINSLNKLAKRVDDLETTHHRTDGLLSAMQGTLKGLLEYEKKFRDSSDASTEATLRISSSLTELTGLRQSFDAFIGEYQTSRKDKLGDVFQELKRHVDMGNLIHETLLEVMVDGSGTPAKSD